MGATGGAGAARGGVRDAADAVLPIVSEADLAAHLERTGRRCVVHRGRHWVQIVPGFFRPVHVLARLSRREATRPVAVCWGWQACLAEADGGTADAAVPAHVVSDLDGFDESSLRHNRRSQLRKARRLAHMVELLSPDLLLEQGHAVLRSAHARTGYGRLPTEEEFGAELRRLGDPAYGIVLAGVVQGRLGAYVTANAVDGTAYVRETVIATEALSTGLGVGLRYEVLALCARTPGIREVVHGLHAPENPTLCRYKEEFGMPPRRVPARVGLLPGVGWALRRRSPDRFYRLTGRS